VGESWGMMATMARMTSTRKKQIHLILDQNLVTKCILNWPGSSANCAWLWSNFHWIVLRLHVYYGRIMLCLRVNCGQIFMKLCYDCAWLWSNFRKIALYLHVYYAQMMLYLHVNYGQIFIQLRSVCAWLAQP
jgi:hypothetical protein